MSDFELTPLRKSTMRPIKRVGHLVSSPAVRKVKHINTFPLPRQIAACESSYWKDFYQYWDDFVANWKQSCDSHAKPSDRISSIMFARTQKLAANEMPEPYLGFPHEKVSAVMLNMNPGMSQGPLDEEKLFNNQRGKARLFDYLVDCKLSYREFLRQYSSLYSALNDYVGTDKEVAGVEWWQRKRLPWLGRIYGYSGLEADKVFSLEICPYHSRSTYGFQNLVTMRSVADKVEMLEHLFGRVLQPAIRATWENKLPFATCIGAGYVTIFDKLNAMRIARVQCEGRWAVGKRKYSVHSVSSAKMPSDIGKALFLVTWQSSGWGNPPPDGTEEILKVEAEIRNKILTLS